MNAYIKTIRIFFFLGLLKETSLSTFIIIRTKFIVYFGQGRKLVQFCITMLLQKGQNQHFQKCLSSAGQERTACCHMEKTFYTLCNIITIISFLNLIRLCLPCPNYNCDFLSLFINHRIQVGRLLDLFYSHIS